MATKIFVNLPVKDLKRSMDFFTKLGFTFNPQFTDETAACMIVSGDIFVMLLTEAKFKEFTPKPICDATKSTEVLVCLSRESRDTVNELIRNALAAGGTSYAEFEGLRVHVSARLSGPRWPHLGVDLHGPSGRATGVARSRNTKPPKPTRAALPCAPKVN